MNVLLPCMVKYNRVPVSSHAYQLYEISANSCAVTLNDRCHPINEYAIEKSRDTAPHVFWTDRRSHQTKIKKKGYYYQQHREILSPCYLTLN